MGFDLFMFQSQIKPLHILCALGHQDQDRAIQDRRYFLHIKAHFQLSDPGERTKETCLPPTSFWAPITKDPDPVAKTADM